MPDFAHNYDFDPAYCYQLDDLLAIEPPPEPDDFELFWRTTYEEALTTPLRPTFSEVPSPKPGFRVRIVRYDGWQGVRLGAWLVEPIDAEVTRYAVIGHGYYNRPIEDIWYPPNTAALFFACRGLGLSRTDGISDQTALHVLNGIEDKATYVHRGCVADVWAAASLHLQLFPEAAVRLEYFGESFGGGIGTMALAWDDRFSFATIRVPSFGHHPLRLRMRCNGAGEAVRRRWERSTEIYGRTLRYFDAAVHAQRLKLPTHFACALFDPAVPPPGQFAVFNAAPEPKSLTVCQTGHHGWSGTAADVNQADADAEALRLAFLNS